MRPTSNWEIAPVTVNRLVTSSSDDAEENRGDGSVGTTSSDLELVDESVSTEQLVGMRFLSMNIPQYAQITNAYVQFTADVTSTGNPILYVKAHDTASPNGFGGTNDISNRDTTTSSVLWQPAQWNVADARTANERTNDLTSVIQEIVSRGDWSSGNSIAIIVTGNGEREAESYDGAIGDHADASRAPELFVTYDDATSIYVYDNETTGTFGGQANCGTTFTRTFSVSDNITINDLDVGLNIEHSYRGDLTVQLTSPQGTTVTLINQVNDSDDNYDILLDDESGNAVDDGTNNDLGAPVYGDDRTAAPDNPLSGFDGENASGTWTLTFCNVDQRGSDSRDLIFNSARLYIDGSSANGGTPSGNLSCSAGTTEITGTVFEDYNYDGDYDSGETQGIDAITVTATDSLGNSFNDVTDTGGAFAITGLVAGRTYRIEFTNIPDWATPTFYGGDNGTTVQFVQPGNCANLALISPDDYCQSAPRIITSCYVEGDAPANADVLVSVAYSPSGTQDNSFPNLSHEGLHSDLGTTWGLAYQRSSNTAFVASFQKRHTAYGSAASTGAIYQVPNPSDNATTGTSLFLDLNALYGSNVAGNDPHPSGTNYLTDDASFPLVGKIALGDLDISPDELFLWTINLNNRQLYKIPLGTDPTNPVAPSTTGELSLFPLYDICDCDGDGSDDLISDVDIRPFGISIHRGKVYVGIVCSAESTPTDFSKLRGKVFEFDEGTSNFTEVLDFPLNYNRGVGYSGATSFPNGIPTGSGYNTSNPANWRPWRNTYTTASTWDWSWYDPSFREGGFPQPIISDIAFDENNNMLIGIRDRFGDMVGDGANEPGGSTLLESDGTGDIVRATPSGASWSFSTVEATDGTEFFDEDNYTSQHEETSMGGLAILKGADRFVYTAMDPVTNLSGGFDWTQPSNGTLERSYQVYRRPSGQSGSSDLFAKANGLGDAEFLCNPAPVQIGNYVWEDTDGDGVQDAGEAGLNGVRMELYDNAGTLLAFDTTNSLGYYFFSGNGIDNAEWQTANDTLQALTTYYIVAGGNGQFVSNELNLNNTSYLLTQTDIDSGANREAIDNDGSIASGIDPDFNGEPYLQITTGNIGEVSHNFDFGFKPPCSLSVTSIMAQNCSGSGSGPFAAEWQLIVEYAGEPSGDISYQRNSQPVASFTPNNSPDTIIIAGIPADGGGSDTIRIYFTNDTSCGDTIIRKRPVPCPTNVSGSNTPGDICTSLTNTEIGGLVFDDWNYDGSMNQSDTVGVQGIQVNLYDDCGSVTQTTFTDSNGNYLFSGLTDGTTYRIEFTIPTTIEEWAKPTQAGDDNGTTVQFVQPGVCANLGVASPLDYCNTNPYLATPCYVFGDQDDVGNPNSTDGVMVSMLASWGEDNVAPIETSTDVADWQTGGTPQYLALANQIGTTYGIAYNSINNKLYAASFLKNFAGFGADGPGAIYEMEINPATGQVIANSQQTFVQINNLGVSVCSDPHGADLTSAAVLDNLIEQVGKCGLGDLEISDDGQFLYTINLSSKEVVAIRIADGSLYGKWKVPENQAETNDPATDIRPFALAYKRGQLYVGMMATAESSQDQNDIWAYVYEMDPTSGSFSQIFKGNYLSDFPFHYARPWQNSWADIRNDAFDLPENTSNRVIHYSPILADIEFFGEDMTLSFRNRTGDQWGDNIPDPLHSTPNTLVSAIQIGELACVYWDGLQYQPELNGNCGNNRSTSQSGIVGFVGNTQVEFYWGDGRNNFYGGTGGHLDGSYGGLATIDGDKLAWTNGSVLDAFGVEAFDYGAMGIMSHQDGTLLMGYGIYQGNRDTEGIFGKANGLGDLEAICKPAPLEIGNYVWEDSDGDGIQDACEAPLDSVIVTLYNVDCGIVAIDTTDAKGEYYFNDEKIAAYTAQSDTTLAPNSTYYIVISGAVGGNWTTADSTLAIGNNHYKLTNADQGGNDEIDSDGTVGSAASPCNSISDGFVFATVTTQEEGTVDHSYDFGFIQCTVTAPVIAADQSICDGDDPAAFTVTTPASGNGTLTYQWQSSTTDCNSGFSNIGGETNPTYNAPVIAQTTYYRVIVTNTNHSAICRDTSNCLTVTVNPNPTITIDNVQCDVLSFPFTYDVNLTTNANTISSTAGTVTGNGGGSFTISDIPDGQDITITATITASGCQTQENVTAPNCTCPTVNPPSSGGDQNYCAGSTIPTLSVSVNAGETADWYDMSSGGTQLATGTTTYTPTGAGTFYAEARNTANACTSNTRTAVTLTEVPQPEVNTTNTDICEGLSIDLDTLVANVGNTTPVDTAYFLSLENAVDSMSAITSVVSPTTTTKYYVRLSINNQSPYCYDIDSLIITVNNIVITSSTTCDDNGTGGDNNDDTFTVTVNATNASPGASGQYLVIYNGNILNGSGTNYGTEVTVSHGDFVANGVFSPVLTIRDADDVGCEETETVPAVNSCSVCPPTICLPIKVEKKSGAN